MAYSYNTRLVVVSYLMVVGFANLGRSASQVHVCKGLHVGPLMTHCGPNVQIHGPKIPPSNECCILVRGVDVPCVCRHLSSDDESKISVEKAVYVSRHCGIKLEAGTKCGSYTIPPPEA